MAIYGFPVAASLLDIGTWLLAYSLLFEHIFGFQAEQFSAPPLKGEEMALHFPYEHQITEKEGIVMRPHCLDLNMAVYGLENWHFNNVGYRDLFLA